MSAKIEIVQNTREKFYDEGLLQIYRNRSHNLRGKKIKFIRSNHKGCSEDLLIIR